MSELGVNNILRKHFNFPINTEIYGTDRAFLGLYSIFKYLKLNSKKTKILYTPVTCASAVFASVYAGFKPIFCEISLNDYLINEQETAKIIQEQHDDIAGIVYIYTFGHINDSIFSIKKLADSFNIPLIEDVAQAFGAGINGQMAGTIGDFTVFSFGYSKHINEGNGGALVCNNTSNYNSKEIWNLYQKTKKNKHDEILSNQYLNDFYSLRLKALKNPEKFLEYKQFIKKYKKIYFKKYHVNWNSIVKKIDMFFNRNQVNIRYEKAMEYKSGILQNGLNDFFSLPSIKKGSSIYRYTFLVKNSSLTWALSEKLRENNIHCSNLYIPVSRFFYNHGFQNSLSFSRSVINLWVDETVNKAYIKKTILLLVEFMKDNHNETKF
jgi:dTDP-4-amino-4,6-dideoxygalactose transaminase